MKAPAFWWQPSVSPLAAALWPVGAVVGRIAARRMRQKPAVRLAIPVICIGNPTVGGAGKTPVALAVAALLSASGRRPVFLTRGYRGRLPGPVVVAAEHTAADVGDEALLLADIAPTVVSRDRGAGGRLAATLGDVVVMDDGFQNPRLAKDFAVLVVDAAVGIGNGLVTPAGPLRASFAAHLPTADALALTLGSETGGPVAALPPSSLAAHMVRLVPHASRPLDGVAVLAFAGIGRPEKFFAGLAALGAVVTERHAFGDHAPYDEETAERLLTRAATKGLRLVSTAKDIKRLSAGGEAAGRLAAETVVVDVEAALPPELSAAILSRVREGPASP